MATATYNQEVLTPQATTGTTETITHYTIQTTASGVGAIVGKNTLTNTSTALSLGERYRVPANDIVITQPAGPNLPASGAMYVLSEVVDATLYLAQHTGDPGTDGSNEATYSGYSRTALAPANWTIA